MWSDMESRTVCCKNLPFLKEFDESSPSRLLILLITSFRFIQALLALLVITSGCHQAKTFGDIYSQHITLVCFPDS